MSYELHESVPDPETFVALRESAVMAPRSVDAARTGLESSLYGVSVTDSETGETVGMARIVGDGGCVYHLCDMVVRPDHQGAGVGTRMMDALMAYLESTPPKRRTSISWPTSTGSTNSGDSSERRQCRRGCFFLPRTAADGE